MTAPLGRGTLALITSCLCVAAVVTLLSGDSQGSLRESVSWGDIPPLMESDAASRTAVHSKVEAALSALSSEIVEDEAADAPSSHNYQKSHAAPSIHTGQPREANPAPFAVAQKVAAMKAAIRRQRLARDKMRRFAALMGPPSADLTRAGDLTRVSDLTRVGDTLAQTTRRMQETSAQLEQLGERDSLKQQLAAEHSALLQSQATVQLVKQQAVAMQARTTQQLKTAIQAVQTRVLHVAQVAAASIKQRTVSLARAAARDEAQRWVTKRGSQATDLLEVAGGGHKTAHKTAHSTEEEDALTVAKRALREVKTSTAMQVKTRKQLKTALQHERMLGVALRRQRAETRKLAKHTDHVTAALTESLKKETAKAVAPLEQNRELSLMVKAERQQARAQVRALQIQLQQEHTKRLQAEATVAAVHVVPPRVKQPNLLSTTTAPSTAVVVPEEHRKKSFNKSSKSQKYEKLRAARRAVAAAKAAMLKAGALSRQATTSSNLARTEVKAERIAAELAASGPPK